MNKTSRYIIGVPLYALLYIWWLIWQPIILLCRFVLCLALLFSLYGVEEVKSVWKVTG